MSRRPLIALRVIGASPGADALAQPDPRWRLRHLVLAPHRLAFFLAVLVLIGASLGWALVQFERIGLLPTLPHAVSPTLLHATVMTFGFLPLFFSGFLFTAGPRWLAVPAPGTQPLLAPLALQASAWLLWLTLARWQSLLALGALLMAWSGLCWTTVLFWRLVRASPAPDRVHAVTVGLACAIGCLCLLGVALSLALDATDAALAWVRSGLWGFVVVVFVTVTHRMIPFFTSSALPSMAAWRPFWSLGLMLGVAAFELAAVWVEFSGRRPGIPDPRWMLVRGLVEFAAGAVLLWLALIWGLVPSFRTRLLAMLHVGFLWLGLALVLGGTAQLLGLAQGAMVLGLASLHALTMGCLASLMLAMVTRVSCGHSGRALLADNLVWSLFWLLQLATVLRVVAAAQSAISGWLLLVAAPLWTLVMLAWGIRLGNWYGRPRADGRPG